MSQAGESKIDKSMRITLVRFNVNLMTFSRVYHWSNGDPREPLELAAALFEFMVEAAQQSGNPQRLFKSPTVLAARYVVWTALRQNPTHPTRLRGVGVVAEDRYVHADVLLDVNCGQLGELLAFPDIRCMVQDGRGGFKELHLRPFQTYRNLLREEETTM
jgi:hypothetical protein